MNKDKAIQLLERLQDPEPYEPMLTKDAYDAIQMAIDALSADGDTISRKAAIEICGHAIDLLKGQFGAGALVAIKESIEELPPAQPEISDGRLWVKVDDIEQVDAVVVTEHKSKFCREFWMADADEPAQPQRIKGRWIHHPEIGWGETWLCDQCGEKTTSTVIGKPRANFCPNCGADMSEVTT